MRSRGRGTFISAVGVVLLAVVACSRSAQQKNFLGEPCTTEGDCPAELTCVAGACWEPCQPGGVCDDGYVCQLGACVPGGSAVPPDAAPPVDSATRLDSSVLADAVAPPLAGDGQLVQLALPADFTNSEASTASLDDTSLVYVKSEKDPFGQETRTLRRIPFGGGAATVAYTFAADECTSYGRGLFVDGWFYCQNTFLNRIRISDGSLTQIAPIPGGGGGGGSLTRSGSKITFEDYDGATGNSTLRVYDTATSTLDPTAYSPRPRKVSIEGNLLTWVSLEIGGGGDVTNQFHQATLGNPGGPVLRTLPGTSSLTSIVAVGSDALVLLQTGGTGGNSSLFKMKLTDMAAPAALGSARFFSIGVEEGKMYLYEIMGDAGVQGSRLVRIDVSGTQTTFGSMGSLSYAQSFMTPTAVYAVTYPMSGNPAKLYKWMKPAP